MKRGALIAILILTSSLISCTTTRPAGSRITAYGVEQQEVITNSLFDLMDRTISEKIFNDYKVARSSSRTPLESHCLSTRGLQLIGTRQIGGRMKNI